MIIGIDASRANRSHKSGTEWYSYYMIRALTQLDPNNEYILYSDTPLTGGLADLTAPDDTTAATVNVDANNNQTILSRHNNVRGKILRWPYRFFWTQGRLSLEMLWHRPDILFVPAHALPIIHPRQSVVTIHDIGFRSDPTLYEKARLGADSKQRHRFINMMARLLTLGKYGANTFDYLEWSTRFSLKHAQTVIAISEFTKQALIEAYQTTPEKVAVVHNGYPAALYKSIPDQNTQAAVLARHGIKPPYIFYVGRLDKKKNITTLIEAFARLKQRRGQSFQHTLCLAGDASFGFDEVKYTIHEYNVMEQVRLIGWVAEADLPSLFAAADAFVFPSRYEGFGIPLLQAMAMETPIAASSAASIPEVVGEAAVLFDPTNAEEMSLALEKVIYDQSTRERLIAAGTKRVQAFSWEKAAQKLLDIFQDRGQKRGV